MVSNLSVIFANVNKKISCGIKRERAVNLYWKLIEISCKMDL